MSEEWKVITTYPNYSISSLGNVKNNITNRILRPYIRNGYYSLTLCKNNIKKTYNIHTIVAEYFLQKPDNNKKYVVNHIDENKLNNSIDNLEYLTYKENTLYSSSSSRSKNNEEFNLNDYKEIPNYSNYMVSKEGNIYSKSIKRLSCKTVLPNGYHKIKLKSDDNEYKDLYIHVIVAMTYLNYIPSKDYVINHINGVKGDNNISNLEIVTQKQNMQHSVKLNNDRIFRKSVYYTNELNEKIVYKSIKEASDSNGIDNSSIAKSCKSETKQAGNKKWWYV